MDWGIWSWCVAPLALHSTRIRRIEYLMGDSQSRRAAPESRGLRALLFRAIRQFRTEHLNSLAVGGETVEHVVDSRRESRELVVRHDGGWHPLAKPPLRNPLRDTFDRLEWAKREPD